MTDPIRPPLDIEALRRSLPPVGFWCYPWERTIHQLLSEIDRLRLELKDVRELYEANHG